MAGIATSHTRLDTREWLILSPRHGPGSTLAAQITFALKNEGVDLSVLAALVSALPAERLEEAILTSPSGKYMRRFWFLAEWLKGSRLSLPDVSKKRGLESVVDPALQFCLETGDVSERHRLTNNLPGTPAFCPMVRRTEPIQQLVGRGLRDEARMVAGRTHPDIMARASAFLLLSDSKASFQIERERPSPDRTRRWAQAIARAGSMPLSTASLLALQETVIGDARFVTLGLRDEGGFVGSRDRISGAPLPEHVSARPDDLESLIAGLVAYQERVLSGRMDPIASAASMSFGLVYIHPFEDGNGRLHRWLIHQTLAATGFTPGRFVFPISRVLLRRIDAYRKVLESYSRPLLEYIDWEPTPEGKVRVRNQTGDYYRFFDATAQAEFLYECVAESVDRDLPEEVAYLEAFDRFAERVQAIVDMPERTLDTLRRFLEQNGGTLSGRARSREFEALSDDEASAIERHYAETLGRLRP
jgi:Fic/DOC family protein